MARTGEREKNIPFQFLQYVVETERRQPLVLRSQGQGISFECEAANNTQEVTS
jgi:hypothetical protein